MSRFIAVICMAAVAVYCLHSQIPILIAQWEFTAAHAGIAYGLLLIGFTMVSTTVLKPADRSLDEGDFSFFRFILLVMLCCAASFIWMNPETQNLLLQLDLTAKLRFELEVGLLFAFACVGSALLGERVLEKPDEEPLTAELETADQDTVDAVDKLVDDVAVIKRLLVTGDGLAVSVDRIYALAQRLEGLDPSTGVRLQGLRDMLPLILDIHQQADHVSNFIDDESIEKVTGFLKDVAAADLSGAEQLAGQLERLQAIQPMVLPLMDSLGRIEHLADSTEIERVRALLALLASPDLAALAEPTKLEEAVTRFHQASMALPEKLALDERKDLIKTALEVVATYSPYDDGYADDFDSYVDAVKEEFDALATNQSWDALTWRDAAELIEWARRTIIDAWPGDLDDVDDDLYNTLLKWVRDTLKTAR